MDGEASPLAKARPGIRFDQGAHARAKIGFVLLATEQTIQDDVMRLRPPGVGIHFTRAFIPDRIANDTLGNQLGRLADASATLLPDGSLDVVCYACTSGSIVMGEDRVHAELKRGNPNAKPTSLIAGVIKALRELGVKSLAVATPYLDEINRLEARYLEAAGFDVVNIEGLNVERDSDMVRITPEYLSEFAQTVDRKGADCLFFSCGAMRSLGIVAELEARLSKPVVVSNQAMIWDTWRMAGVRDQVQGYGQLLSAH
jgi:maleate isomerase